MALSTNAICRLAEVLAPEVVDYIYNDERFYELMMEIVPDAIADKLGNVDDSVAAELTMAISERIAIKAV